MKTFILSGIFILCALAPLPVQADPTRSECINNFHPEQSLTLRFREDELVELDTFTNGGGVPRVYFVNRVPGQPADTAVVYFTAPGLTSDYLEVDATLLAGQEGNIRIGFDNYRCEARH